MLYYLYLGKLESRRCLLHEGIPSNPNLRNSNSINSSRKSIPTVLSNSLKTRNCNSGAPVPASKATSLSDSSKAGTATSATVYDSKATVYDSKAALLSTAKALPAAPVPASKATPEVPVQKHLLKQQQRKQQELQQQQKMRLLILLF